MRSNKKNKKNYKCSRIIVTKKQYYNIICTFSIILAALVWPEGSYALPQSIYGCPYNKEFPWVKGHILLTSPKSNPPYQWSLHYHMRGPIGHHQVALHFCSRLNEYVSEITRNSAPRWPPGKYCVYQMGNSCPSGKYTRCYKYVC